MPYSIAHTYNLSAGPAAATANLETIYYTDFANIYKLDNYGAGTPINLTTASPYSTAAPWSVACSADGSIVLFGDATGTNPSLYTSTDSGSTFSTYTFTDASVANGTVLWVAMSEDGQYRVCFLVTNYPNSPQPTYLSISEDSGSSWSTPMLITLPTSNVLSAKLYINGGTKTLFYTSYNYTDTTSTEPGYLGKYVWTSDPTTGAFTDLTTGKSGVNGLAFWSLAVSSNAQHITVSADGGGLFVSSDGGSTWTTVWTTTETGNVAMSADGTIQFAQTLTRFSYSTDSGATWTNVLYAYQVAGMSFTFCTTDGQRAMLGTDPVLLDISYTSGVACFPAGMRILTPSGYKPVEDIHTDDLLVTSDKRAVPVTVYSTTLHTSTETAPYLIPANTFGKKSPPSDIILSPTHAIQVRKGVWEKPRYAAEEYSIIRQVDIGKEITYYHFEAPDYLRDNFIVENSIVESFSGKQYKGLKDRFYKFNKTLKGYTRISSGSAKLRIEN